MLDGKTALPSGVPATWDGTGLVPFGWTRSQLEVWTKGASDAWLTLDDLTAAFVANSAAVSAPNKAAVAAQLPGRSDVAEPTENETRTLKPEASTASVEAEAEPEKDQ